MALRASSGSIFRSCCVRPTEASTLNLDVPRVLIRQWRPERAIAPLIWGSLNAVDVRGSSPEARWWSTCSRLVRDRDKPARMHAQPLERARESRYVLGVPLHSPTSTLACSPRPAGVEAYSNPRRASARIIPRCARSGKQRGSQWAASNRISASGRGNAVGGLMKRWSSHARVCRCRCPPCVFSAARLEHELPARLMPSALASRRFLRVIVSPSGHLHVRVLNCRSRAAPSHSRRRSRLRKRVDAGAVPAPRSRVDLQAELAGHRPDRRVEDALSCAAPAPGSGWRARYDVGGSRWL